MKKVLFSQQPPRLSARPGDTPAEPIDPEGIAITEAAATEIKRQATQRGAAVPALRLGIKGGGCTGFSYMFDWADAEPRETDKVFSQHGVSVYVDPKSFKLLKGTQLDFSRSLMGYGFKFNNPNAKGTCGCGESVQF
jgi:iron-sulfur cluster assembly protein